LIDLILSLPFLDRCVEEALLGLLAPIRPYMWAVAEAQTRVTVSSAHTSTHRILRSFHLQRPECGAVERA